MMCPPNGSIVYPVRIIHTSVTITPTMAHEWLKYNRNIRKLVRHNLAALKHSIRRGTAKFQHAIVWDWNGWLIDGQHRLMACVETGIAIICDVVYGAPPDANFDIGSVRSSAIIARGMGVTELKNGHIATAMTKVVIAWERFGIDRFLVALRQHADNYIITKDEVGEWLLNNYSTDLFGEANIVATQMRKLTNFSALAGAIYYIFAQVNRDAAKTFFGQLIKPIGLEEDMPSYVLHQRLIAGAKEKRFRIDKFDLIRLFFRAFRYHCTGHRTTRLSHVEGEQLILPPPQKGRA